MVNCALMSTVSYILDVPSLKKVIKVAAFGGYLYDYTLGAAVSFLLHLRILVVQ